ncbi:MAG: hypothetical protein IPP50_13960 [Piscinibacter sp.]|nr:hypothetical protein [Piscinibacter sp.]
MFDAGGSSALPSIAQRLPAAVCVVIARSLAETSEKMLCKPALPPAIHRALPADDFVTRLRELVKAHGGREGR